jgi:hypothetical protein
MGDSALMHFVSFTLIEKIVENLRMRVFLMIGGASQKGYRNKTSQNYEITIVIVGYTIS